VVYAVTNGQDVQEDDDVGFDPSYRTKE